MPSHISVLKHLHKDGGAKNYFFGTPLPKVLKSIFEALKRLFLAFYLKFYLYLLSVVYYVVVTLYNYINIFNLRLTNVHLRMLYEILFKYTL